MERMHHPRADVDRMYLPRNKGGRGLIQLEIAYKIATIGLDAYLNAAKNNPPRSENGRKIGYMSLMKDMWYQLVYGHLAFSSRNLRDKAAVLERTVGNLSRDIFRNVGRANGTRLERGNVWAAITAKNTSLVDS